MSPFQGQKQNQREDKPQMLSAIWNRALEIFGNKAKGRSWMKTSAICLTAARRKNWFRVVIPLRSAASLKL